MPTRHEVIATADADRKAHQAPRTYLMTAVAARTDTPTPMVSSAYDAPYAGNPGNVRHDGRYRT